MKQLIFSALLTAAFISSSVALASSCFVSAETIRVVITK